MNNTGKTILSILIPTIPERTDQAVILYNELHRQIESLKMHPMLGDIEILIDERKSFLNGGPSIGKKCESLIDRAAGVYSLLLHDDDWVAPNFVESIVRLCQHDRDICTFRSISKLDDFWMLVDMSIHYQNDQPTPMYTIRRKPFPICAVRSEFAKLFPFPDTNYSEDSDWMEKVLTRCANEAHSEEILHEYRHSKHTSEADRITNYGRDRIQS
jgi:hypothetical protein